MSRAEDALMRLYENPALRQDLTDAPAERLLQWAEARLAELDATAADEAAFAAGEEALLATLKGMNQAVASALNAPASLASAQAAPLDEMAVLDRLIAAADAGEPIDAGMVVAQAAPTAPPPDLRGAAAALGSAVRGAVDAIAAAAAAQVAPPAAEPAPAEPDANAPAAFDPLGLGGGFDPLGYADEQPPTDPQA